MQNTRVVFVQCPSGDPRDLDYTFMLITQCGPNGLAPCTVPCSSENALNEDKN